MHSAFKNTKTHLATIGDRGNQIDGCSLGVLPQHRRLPLGRIATHMLAIRSQTRLITPVDLRLLLLGARLNLGVIDRQLALNVCRLLFIGLLFRLLHRESPALEIFGDQANRHRLPGFLPDQLLNSLMGPQGILQIQLIRCMVSQLLLQICFIFGAQLSARAKVSTTPLGKQRVPATLTIFLQPSAYCKGGGTPSSSPISWRVNPRSDRETAVLRFFSCAAGDSVRASSRSMLEA